MNSKLSALMLAYGSLVMSGMYGAERKYEITSSTSDSEHDKMIRKGLRLFSLEGIRVYAVNKKSARKKLTKIFKQHDIDISEFCDIEIKEIN